jgi:hypothetical protein
MVVRASHAARKSQPIHDDGRRAQGNHLEPGFPRVPVQINEDVNPVVHHFLGNRRIVEMTYRNEVIDRLLEATMESVIDLGPAVVREDLNSGSVVITEYVRHQEAHCVLAKVGREIPDP